jgi:hypothetical protein
MTNLEKHERFILKNWVYFISMLGFSEFMTLDRIRKYQSVLFWGDFCEISEMKWNEEIIDEFSVYLLNHCPSFISNDKITWTVELINKYKADIDWNYLVENKGVLMNLDICNAFKPEMKVAMEDNFPCCRDEKYIELILDFTGEKYAEYHLTKISDFVKSEFEKTFTKISDVEAFDTINWDCLSKNTDLPWSVQFIEKHADKFDWYHLSWNESLPWSPEFIAQYANRWNWSVLSSNSAIAWNEDLIDTYIDKIDWERFTQNYAIDFNHEFFHKYKDRFLKHDVGSVDIATRSNNFRDKIVIVNNDEIYNYNDYFKYYDYCSFVKWDIETIRQYENHINWISISHNVNMDWTIELLNEFSDQLDMGNICQNKKLWNDVFSVLTEADLDYFIDKIIALNKENG